MENVIDLVAVILRMCFAFCAFSFLKYLHALHRRAPLRFAPMSFFATGAAGAPTVLNPCRNIAQ